MRGSVTSKCMKRHRNADKVCSSRCLRWYYVIDARDQQGGRRRQWSTGYPTKKAAQQALTEELQRRQQGIVLEQAKITLREHVDRWLEHLAILGRDERTIERYAELLGLHVLPYLGGTPLRELTPLHLTDLYAMLLREGRKDGGRAGLHHAPSSTCTERSIAAFPRQSAGGSCHAIPPLTSPKKDSRPSRGPRW